MPIVTLQRQMRELGRIRTGSSRPGKGGKKVPIRLETFRLTSSTRELVEHAAEEFGGTVEPWEGRQFQVTTERDAIDIVIPPGELVSQWYELWAGGGCLRRCTGEQNVLTMGPCECPADPTERNDLAAKGEACKPTTRLRVMLPQLPDIGVWLLESHGYYAAVELAGMADILAAATARGLLLPARLRLDQREKKVPGQPTNRYAVPTIELVQTRMSDLVELPSAGAPVPRLGMGRATLLEPPRAPLPDASDFRAPLAGVDPEDAVVVDGTAVDATDGIELTELGRDIREAAGRAAGEPWALLPVSDEQRRTLAQIFEGMAPASILAGNELVFGHRTLANAGEAAAIVGQLVNAEPGTFRHRWTLMLEAVRP